MDFVERLAIYREAKAEEDARERVDQANEAEQRAADGLHEADLASVDDLNQHEAWLDAALALKEKFARDQAADKAMAERGESEAILMKRPSFLESIGAATGHSGADAPNGADVAAERPHYSMPVELGARLQSFRAATPMPTRTPEPGPGMTPPGP
jgi:hypothetical protein